MIFIIELNDNASQLKSQQHIFLEVKKY